MLSCSYQYLGFIAHFFDRTFTNQIITVHVENISIPFFRSSTLANLYDYLTAAPEYLLEQYMAALYLPEQKEKDMNKIEVKGIEKQIEDAVKFLCMKIPHKQNVKELNKTIQDIFNVPLLTTKEVPVIYFFGAQYKSISTKIIDSFCIVKKVKPKISARDALIIAFLQTESLNRQFSDAILNTALFFVIGDH